MQMNRYPFKTSLSLAFIVILVSSIGWTAKDAGIEQFYGEYVGVSLSDPDNRLLVSDLDVTIHSHDSGFIMEWVTVTPFGNDQVERLEHKVKFHPTEKGGIYAAAMRPDLFGGWIPLDPFKGDPFMWARVSESTLTVYAMLITDSGAHDMQIYKRTLTADGLDLKFKRLRNEDSLGEIYGILKRIR